MSEPTGRSQRNHDLLRWTVAVLAVVIATTIMWSDGAVDAWRALVKLALTWNAEATSTVMGVRRWGDADLHILLWSTVTLVVLWATRTRSQAIGALLALLGWSAFTELAQPWFAEQRTRQGLDFAGNAIGILLAAAAFWVFTRIRQRRVPVASIRA
jgi:hypothetical protein